MNNNTDKFSDLIGRVFKDEQDGILWVVVDRETCPEPQKRYARGYNYDVFLYTGAHLGGYAVFDSMKKLDSYHPLSKDEIMIEAMLNPANNVTTWGVELNYD